MAQALKQDLNTTFVKSTKLCERYQVVYSIWKFQNKQRPDVLSNQYTDYHIKYYWSLCLSHTCAFIRLITGGHKNDMSPWYRFLSRISFFVPDIVFCPGYRFLSRSKHSRWRTQGSKFEHCIQFKWVWIFWKKIGMVKQQGKLFLSLLLS